MPNAHVDVFKKELDRLVQIGVLEPCGRSEWIAGTFIIPKKDQSVRWISDFRALNNALRRKVCPIPRIADTLARRTGYKFLSKLDISMMYCTIELDDESKDLCTVVPVAAGPFPILRAHTNNTVTVLRGAHVQERVNIRRLKLYTGR